MLVSLFTPLSSLLCHSASHCSCVSPSPKSAASQSVLIPQRHSRPLPALLQQPLESSFLGLQGEVLGALWRAVAVNDPLALLMVPALVLNQPPAQKMRYNHISDMRIVCRTLPNAAKEALQKQTCPQVSWQMMRTPHARRQQDWMLSKVCYHARSVSEQFSIGLECTNLQQYNPVAMSAVASPSLLRQGL